MSFIDQQLLEKMEPLALSAGARVMQFHRKCAVEHKSDNSPVTQADREAEQIIIDGLRAAFPEIPIVAEEEAAVGRLPERLGNAFFLVDPLDGTKEFINGHGDFTVNIALIRDGSPALGVVYAPVSGSLYSGRPGMAEIATIDANQAIAARHAISARPPGETMTIVASRSHRDNETEKLIMRHPGAEIVTVGSSLKFCIVAAGEADYYPRCGPTMQWDTAAGDAVLRAAGGMTSTLDGQPLAYGALPAEKPFLNPSFIAEGKRSRS